MLGSGANPSDVASKRKGSFAGAVGAIGCGPTNDNESRGFVNFGNTAGGTSGCGARQPSSSSMVPVQESEGGVLSVHRHKPRRKMLTREI